MINQLKKLLGIAPKADYKSLMAQGAMIVDVRTPAEFSSGHIKGSVNIPLQELSKRAQKLKKDRVIITCCASGMRSASAKGVLKSMGFTEVYNGGGWLSLRHKI